MKVRQRWRPEEDALLRSYVKQYGPRDWNLVSQRMNVTFTRDAKSCLERWKNYLKPGIKKGSLTEEEQQLVIHLQAKHGNKWKKIAAEVPGRTAKRLGKWWEVFKEKQQRELESSKSVEPIEEGKYNHILQSFAEKLVEQGNLLAGIAIPMPIPANSDQPVAPAVLPPWLASSSSSSIITNVRPPSPSVTLSLSPLTVPQAPGIPWLQGDKATMESTSHNMINSLPSSIGVINPLAMNNNNNPPISEIIECCREMEEGHRAWTAHRKEAAWRLKRVELQLESEKATKRKEKMEEIEAKINALREEQKASLDWIEAEYREQLMGLRREAEAKEQKLAEQWSAKHLRLMKFLEQMGTGGIASEANGR